MIRRLPLTAALAILAVVLFAAIFPAVAADDSKPAVTADEVKRLIDELGAPTRAARTAAEKRLLELGPAALPLFPAPDLLGSVSVRVSVDRIRHELERRQARDSIHPSVVSLHGARPLREWIAEISRQTRNRLDGSDLPESILDRPLTLDVAEKPFWATLDEVLKTSRLSFEPESARRGLHLTALNDEPQQPAETIGYAGPFRLSALPAQLSPKRLLRVALYAQPEPRLRPLFLQFATADITAESEGVPFKSFNPDASYELAVNEAGGRSRMQLDFVVPEGASPRQVDLRGSFRMTTAADAAAVRFVDIAKPADGKPLGIERRRGGVTVSLQRVRREPKTDGTCELRIAITVAYDSGGPAFESHRTWIMHNEVFLEVGEMRVPLNGGFETTLQADGAVGMEYRFISLPDPLPEYAFVYMAPTLIVDVPVRFALESVPVRVQE